MENFIYKNHCEVIFGEQPESEIAKAVKHNGARHVLLVYGSERMKKDGSIKKITDEIAKFKIRVTEFGGVVANPLLSHAKCGVELARKSKVDFVLAVGGGSVIDAAKFIAVGASNGQDAEKIYKQGIQGYTILPVGTVLTLPAAGSECSRFSVIRDDATGIKYDSGCDDMRPKFAYINPRYCMSLPKEQIAYGTGDIFAHLLERYFSPNTDVVFTDRLLEGAMKAMLEIAPRLYKNSDSYQLWAQFCHIGTLAHNGMLCMGRPVQDWGTHVIENKLLSGIHNIAHGLGLAILFPGWLEYVKKSKPQKIKQFESNVMTIGELKKFFKGLGMAGSLHEINIDVKSVKVDADKIFAGDVKLGGYAELGKQDILNILDMIK